MRQPELMLKNYRYLLFYILTIGGFSLLMYVIVLKGELLGIINPQAIKSGGAVSGFHHFSNITFQNLKNPLPILLLQIITIIAFARIFGFLCKKVGQPAVIGEIIAGIILGPSLLGFFAPEVSSFLFPSESLNSLQFFSQIGLILFMFIVGMDVDLKVLGNKAPEAFVVSHASIIMPFTLGMVLAYYIFASFAPAGVTFISFALFIGISLSITAFPVLARILQERGLMKTRIGTLAITCAAIDDISAWCLLASLIAIVKAGSFVSSIYTILLSIVYVFFMVIIVRPFLKRFGDIFNSKEGISKPVVAVFLITLLGSSYLTELIGIHALFGAFVAGLIMPPNVKFRSILIEKIEDLAVILFLPIFFVFSGLRTEVGLLNSIYLLKVTGIVILIAVAGKFAGSALSLRFVGQSWRDSLIIGALMNTRGLMQLVVLSIGYDLGVLSPEIYTIMIIMALVTTFMTGPALDLINKFLPEKMILPEASGESQKHRILISFGNPENGKVMLRLVNCLTGGKQDETALTTLHLSPSNDLHKYNIEEYEKTSFRPVLKEAGELKLKIETVFKASQDTERDIIEIANSGRYDFIVAGKAHSLYEGSFLGKMIQVIARITNPGRIYGTIKGEEKLFHRSVFDGQTRRLLKAVKIPMGVLIDKGFSVIRCVTVPIYSSYDIFIFTYANKFLQNCSSKAYILDKHNLINQNDDLKQAYESIVAANKEKVEHISSYKNFSKGYDEHDLVLVSLDSWHKYTHDNKSANLVSTLIIKP
jgi:Kef-type K+ transport system membrane component KefB